MISAHRCGRSLTSLACMVDDSGTSFSGHKGELSFFFLLLHFQFLLLFSLLLGAWGFHCGFQTFRKTRSRVGKADCNGGQCPSPGSGTKERAFVADQASMHQLPDNHRFDEMPLFTGLPQYVRLATITLFTNNCSSLFTTGSLDHMAYVNDHRKSSAVKTN